MKKLATLAIVAGLVFCCLTNIQAGSFPNPGAAPVMVTNPPSKPAPVVVDITLPVSIAYSASFEKGDWSKTLSNVFRVPSGKRLVIEYISYNAFLPEGQTLALMVQTVPGLPGVFTMLPVSSPAVVGC